MKLSALQIRLLRLKAQQLMPSSVGLPTSAFQVLTRIAGVQAQDLRAARLSIRARSRGITSLDVEYARQVDRSIAWTWAMRGTLHLITAEDAAWMLPLFGPIFIQAGQRRLKQLGWDEARLADAFLLLDHELNVGTGLTKAAIARMLEEHQLPFEGQATIHFLYYSALQGLICKGADQGNETLYIRYSTWLDKMQPLPHHIALANLARRYLEAYGPAQPEDMVAWSGLKIGEVRSAWKAIQDELVQIETGSQPAWILKKHLRRLDEPSEVTPVVRLIPRFDTYLLGYATRNLTVDAGYQARIHPGGGIIHPVLLVDGQALATWKSTPQKSHLEIIIEPFEHLNPDLTPLIEAEVADIARFLGQEIGWNSSDISRNTRRSQAK